MCVCVSVCYLLSHKMLVTNHTAQSESFEQSKTLKRSETLEDMGARKF